MQHYYVTLTTSGTAYNLKTLIKAINADFRDVGSRVIIQSAKANTGDVFLGASNVTTTNYGHALLAAGDKIEVGPDIGDLWAVPDTNAQILAILFVGA